MSILKRIFITATLFSVLSVMPKSWLTFLDNKSNGAVTLQSNDPSSGNGVLELNGRFDYKKNGTITINQGQQAYFNDFVIPWKQFNAQITINTIAGRYILQEDNNQIVFTSAEHPDWNITIKQTGTWYAIGVYVDAQGRLNAKYVA